MPDGASVRLPKIEQRQGAIIVGAEDIPPEPGRPEAGSLAQGEEPARRGFFTRRSGRCGRRQQSSRACRSLRVSPNRIFHLEIVFWETPSRLQARETFPSRSASRNHAYC
jgi:hypothetical protein